MTSHEPRATLKEFNNGEFRADQKTSRTEMMELESEETSFCKNVELVETIKNTWADLRKASRIRSNSGQKFCALTLSINGGLMNFQAIDHLEFESRARIS